METTAAAAAAAAAVALPDDAIEEILVRVDDPAALFRCTTVCKPWSSLVATPSFLRRRWPENSPESCSLVGFFAPEKRGLGVAREQIFVPAPGSPPLGRCSLGSFYPEAARDWLEHAEPVTSRRGLLLVLLHSRVSPGGIKLAVCNPLAGTCDLLPPLDRYSSDFERYGCIILTGADLLSSKGGAQPPSPLPGYSTFFRVLLCVHQDVWGYDSERISCAYDLLMFSSDDESSSWTEPRECFKQINTRMLEMMGCAVVCRGMAYWLLKSESADYYGLQASVDTGHVVSFTKLSIGLGDHEIAWFHAATNGTTLRYQWFLGNTFCQSHNWGDGRCYQSIQWSRP